MQPFHATVKNGRLTLDAPCDLPDGRVVVLVPLDDLLTLVDEGDGSDDGSISFALPVYAPPPREFKKPKMMDAKAILDELKSL